MIADQNIKDYTTLRIGGSASYFSSCNSIEDLTFALAWCKGRALPYFILGNGSNILVSDNGFKGLVVKLGGDFKKAVFNENTVEAGAGILLPTLSRQFLTKKWGGSEFMCGIPGTIGGAVRINAGTKQGEIKDHFISVKVLAPNGSIRCVYKQDMDFSYRHSCLSNTKDIVLSARFSLPFLDGRKNIKEKIKKIITDRRKRQPKNQLNCGSVFKSPPGGKPAGWYLDQVGLKGEKRGGAMISFEHANWIVNAGDAKSDEMKYLVRLGQKRVYESFGVRLEREVIFLPEDII